MPVDEAIYQEVLSAVQKGEKNRARDLLTRLIKVEKNDPRLWLQMSGVVETHKERIFCLKEVTRLEPGNPTARRGLIWLGVNPPEDDLAIPLQMQQRNWEAQLFTGPSPEKAFQRAQTRQILMTGGAVLILVALIAIIVFSLNRPKPAYVFENPFPSATSGPTPTYEATPSPVVRTITPTAGPLMPLIATLQATYTPTPLTVNTPHPRTEAYRSAISAYTRGDWNNAVTYLQQVATIEPTAADVLYLLGEVYRAQNKLKEALQTFDQAIKVNPGFAPSYVGRARARQAQAPEPSDPIRADLEKAISLDPALGEGYLELAALKLRKKDSKDLLRDLDFSVKLLPNSAQAYLQRAQYHLSQGKAAAALEDARQAFQLDITQLPIYRVLAEALRANKQLSASIEPLETYTRYKPEDFEPLSWLAQAYLERNTENDQAKALKVLDQAVEANRLNHDVYIQRGNIYLELKKGKEAMADFVTASMLRADSFPSMLGRGRASLVLEDGSEAYNFFSKAIQMAGSNAERAAAYYWRAQGLELLKLVPSAIADWEVILRLPAAEIPAEYRETAQKRLQALATATPTASATPTRATPSPAITLTPTTP